MSGQPLDVQSEFNKAAYFKLVPSASCVVARYADVVPPSRAQQDIIDCFLEGLGVFKHTLALKRRISFPHSQSSNN